MKPNTCTRNAKRRLNLTPYKKAMNKSLWVREAKKATPGSIVLGSSQSYCGCPGPAGHKSLPPPMYPSGSCHLSCPLHFRNPCNPACKPLAISLLSFSNPDRPARVPPLPYARWFSVSAISLPLLAPLDSSRNHRSIPHSSKGLKSGFRWLADKSDWSQGRFVPSNCSDVPDFSLPRSQAYYRDCQR